METYKEKILKESFDYKGHYFWENYMLSNLVRTFSKDLKKFEDSKTVLEMYTLLYGEESKPLFEFMVENEEALNEAAEFEGQLLFERSFSAVDLTSKMGQGASLSVLGGNFLRTLWNKLKFLGGGVLGNIGAFLKSGFGWAKEFVKKGAAWVAETPILNVAIPMLMVTGGVAAAKSLINKLRRKAGKKQMTSTEENELENIAQKNKGKIERARKKVLKKAT